MSESWSARVERLTKELEFYQRQNALLKKENFLLKKTILKSLAYIQFDVPPEITLETEEEKPTRWSDKYRRFAGLRGQLLNVAVNLIRKTNAPIHHDEIVSAFQRRYPKAYKQIKDPGETLTRRLRELATEGWLVRPKKGVYFLGYKITQSE